MRDNVILFDLDDTLVVEFKSAQESFLGTAELVKDKYGINPAEFRVITREKAGKLWHQLPVYDYIRKIGVSSWEGLWAG